MPGRKPARLVPRLKDRLCGQKFCPAFARNRGGVVLARLGLTRYRSVELNLGGGAMEYRLTAVVASVFVCALASSAQAAFPGANGKIAYTTNTLNAINPDGSGAQVIPVPDLSGGKDGPNWSADGSQLVFRLRDDLAFINADGGGFRTISVPRNLDFNVGNLPNLGSWSPDSTKVVFETDGCFPHFGPCEFDVWTIRADGTQATPLTSSHTERWPNWSPTGDRIAFEETGGPDPGLYTMDPSGQDVTKIPNTAANDTLPDWSPDGRRIAFARYRPTAHPPQFYLYAINLDGSGLTKLVDFPSFAPAWSPDGTKIAFLGSPDGFFPHNVYTVNADGSSPTPLTDLPNGSSAGGVDWQPIPGPERSDYKNAAQFCKAERDFLGDAAFRQKYGGDANAYGKCVSGSD
jgi:Tol biopolymer transport system component